MEDKELAKIFEKCNIDFSLFLSGSYGRNEHNEYSDVDYLIVVENIYSCLNMRKYLEDLNKEKKNYNYSFIICLKSSFIKNKNNLFVRSIDTSENYIDKLQLIKIIKKNLLNKKDICKYNIQAAFYYLTKYFSTNNDYYLKRTYGFFYKYIAKDVTNYLNINKFSIKENNGANFLQNEIVNLYNNPVIDIIIIEKIIRLIKEEELCISSIYFINSFYLNQYTNIYDDMKKLIFLENQELLPEISIFELR